MNITDQINCGQMAQTQQAAFAVLDSIQGIQPKGIQVSAVALMFLLMCHRYHQDPREVLYKTSAVLSESLSVGRGEYTRAIQQYLKEEL